VHVRLKQTQILRGNKRYVVTTLRYDIFFLCPLPSTFFNCSATVGPTVHVRLKQTQILRRNQKICCDDFEV
jgi:hypothetical protein